MDPAGAPVSFAVGGVSHRTLLAFLSSTCLTCRGFWNAFADRHLAVPGGARLLVITKGSEAESPGTIRKLAPAGVHTILSSDAWRDFNIPVAPYFVLVDGTSNEVIGEGAASTWEQVSDLMAQSLVDLDDAGLHSNASTRPTLGPRRTGRRGSMPTFAPPVSNPAIRACIRAVTGEHDRPVGRRRVCRRRCDPFDVVAVRSFDALEHHPAR